MIFTISRQFKSKTLLNIDHYRLILSKHTEPLRNVDTFGYYDALEGAARYTGLLLAPAEDFNLRPRLFLAIWAKITVFFLA